MRRAGCPEYEARIGLSNRKSGQVLICPRCGADLEVLSVNPPQLDWANLPKDNGRREGAKAKWEGLGLDNTRGFRGVARAICPECRTMIRLDPETEEGQSLYCPYCGTDVEVISLDPAVLDWANSDWEDEDDDEDRGGDDEEEHDWAAASENWKVPRSVRLV